MEKISKTQEQLLKLVSIIECSIVNSLQFIITQTKYTKVARIQCP